MPGVIKDSVVATSVTAPTTSDTVIPPDFSLCRGGPLYMSLAPLRRHGGLVRPGLALPF